MGGTRAIVDQTIRGDFPLLSGMLARRRRGRFWKVKLRCLGGMDIEMGWVNGRVDEFITTNNIECEWTRRTTYDTSLSEEFTATSAAAEEALRGVGGSPPMKRYDADAAEITRVPSAQAAWAWDAATLNPAQLTLAIHQLCVDTGRYDAYAFAPGTSVDRDGDRWKVITPRGAVVCSKVVYATNGYAAGLLPELEALVVPVKGECRRAACREGRCSLTSDEESSQIPLSLVHRDKLEQRLQLTSSSSAQTHSSPEQVFRTTERELVSIQPTGLTPAHCARAHQSSTLCMSPPPAPLTTAHRDQMGRWYWACPALYSHHRRQRIASTTAILIPN